MVFGMTAVRDLQIFVKINSFGVIFIACIILFVFGVGIYGFINTEYTTSETVFEEYEQQISEG